MFCMPPPAGKQLKGKEEGSSEGGIWLVRALGTRLRNPQTA